MNHNTTSIMKKIILTILVSLLALGGQAQTATQVLDKTAAVIGRKGGAQANFKMTSGQYGSASGTIHIKGNKFHARTDNGVLVWFNGKTQWSYMKSTQEVNVSTPTQAQQMSMNPYTFINIYKTGYTSTLKTSGNSYVIHLVARNKQRTVQEMYITINRKTYVPSEIKMRQGKNWMNISVSGFQAKNQPNSTFVFNSKDFPQAEIIDLR